MKQNKHSKYGEDDPATGQPSPARMRDTELIEEITNRGYSVGLELGGDELKGVVLTVSPELWEEISQLWNAFRATFQPNDKGIIEAEIPSEETAGELDQLRADIKSLADQLDYCKRMGGRARSRVRQQDRQIGELRERAQHDVTRWRDAEERLRNVQEANQRLRTENAEFLEQLKGWDAHHCAHREQYQKIKDLKRVVDRLTAQLSAIPGGPY